MGISLNTGRATLSLAFTNVSLSAPADLERRTKTRLACKCCIVGLLQRDNGMYHFPIWVSFKAFFFFLQHILPQYSVVCASKHSKRTNVINANCLQMQLWHCICQSRRTLHWQEQRATYLKENLNKPPNAIVANTRLFTRYLHSLFSLVS